MEPRIIKVAAIQMKSKMADTKYNLSYALSLLEQAAQENCTIACLPELFYSGYRLEKEEFVQLAEKTDGLMSKTLCKFAKDNRMNIIAPYPEKTDNPDVIYNSGLFINENGKVSENVRKVYLWGEEKNIFAPGDKFPIIHAPFGKIGILICYDMEFPEPARILTLKGAEIIFSPSFWTYNAAHRWDVELMASSTFNVNFTVGVNSIEDSEDNIPLGAPNGASVKKAFGYSKIIDPSGEIIAQASPYKEEILIRKIDLNDTTRVREFTPYIRDFKPEFFSMETLKD